MENLLVKEEVIGNKLMGRLTRAFTEVKNLNISEDNQISIEIDEWSEGFSIEDFLYDHASLLGINTGQIDEVVSGESIIELSGEKIDQMMESFSEDEFENIKTKSLQRRARQEQAMTI